MQSLKEREEQDKKYNPAEQRQGGHDDLGVHPERREVEVDDLEKLYNAESAPEKKSKSPVDEKEQDGLDQANQKSTSEISDNNDESGDWDNKTKPKNKQRFSITGKQAAAGGGAIGLLIGGSIGISAFLAGPLQFLQFAKILERFHFSNSEDFSSRRLSKIYRWASKKPPARQDYNLSRTGNKIAVHYEAKLKKQGIGVEFNNPRTGRISSLTLDPNTPAGNRMIAKIEAANGVAMPKDPETGKVRLEFAETSSEITDTRTRRKIISSSVDAMGMNKVSSAMAKRMLKVRAGVDFHPLKNLARSADEKIGIKYKEWRDKVKEDRNKTIKEGSKPPESIKATGTDDPNDPASDTDKAKAVEVDGEMADAQRIAADTSLPHSERVSKIKAKIGVGVGTTAVIGLMCGLDALGDAAGDIQEQNIVQPLTRLATTGVIAPASQIMSGNDVNMDELGVLADSFYNKEDKSSWMSAESIQHNIGKPNTGVKIPDSAKPGKDRPFFFQTLNTITSAPGVSTACNAINSTIGGWIASAAGIAITFTGPAGALLNIATEVGQQVLANTFMDDVVRWLGGEVIDVAGISGGAFGAMADTGAFLADNNMAAGMGGRVLTGEERLTLERETRDKIKQDVQKQPFYARVFDASSPDSLVSKSIIQNDNLRNTQTSFASLIRSPFSVMSSFWSNISNINPRVHAETSSFEYGVDKVGFSPIERDSSLVEDPYANEEAIIDKLPELNEKYGKCFGTTIDPSTGKFQTTKAPSYKFLEENRGDCGAENKDEDFLRYRMYIADTITMTTITCYESIDETACQDIGLTDSNDTLSQTTENSSSSTTLPSGDARALAQQILGNTKIGKDDAAKTQLEGIASGSGPCPSVGDGKYSVDTELLRIIAALGQNNAFTISSLHRGCTASKVGAGTASRHWKGKAVDISGSRGINGVTMPGFDAHDGSGTITRFTQEAARLLPAGCELGVPNQTYINEIRSTNPVCEKIFKDRPETTGATGPHVHIGVP